MLRLTRSAVLAVLAFVTGSVAGCAAPESGRDGVDLLTPPPALNGAPTGRATAPTPAIGPSEASPIGATSGPEAADRSSPAAESLAVPTQLDRDLLDSPERQAARQALVTDWVDPQVAGSRVVEAMLAVPRHAFVPTAVLGEAYADYPLPIGYGQTISQPSLVGKMTELLELADGERVLEIGTGSGYQAAILRELTNEVYSVEIVPELAGTARAVLDGLGYTDVRLDQGDGYLGWPEHAPFDAIIVTAAPDHLPQPLVEQLEPDAGRMVIPIGPVGDVQTLWLVTKEDGETRMDRLLDVRFVPLVRDEGARD